MNDTKVSQVDLGLSVGEVLLVPTIEDDELDAEAEADAKHMLEGPNVLGPRSAYQLGYVRGARREGRS